MANSIARASGRPSRTRPSRTRGLPDYNEPQGPRNGLVDGPQSIPKPDSDNDYLDQINPTLFGEVNEMFSKSDNAFRDTPGFDELYGEQMENISGDIRRNITSGQNSLTRAFMSGGGDISGSGGARFNEMTETGNNQIGDARTQFQNRYNDFVENMYRFDANRSDNLQNVGLRALSGQQAFYQGKKDRQADRKLARSIAKRQQATSLIGSGLDLIGSGIQSGGIPIPGGG